MSRIKIRQKRLRRQFGSIQEITEVPSLLEIQRRSYDSFLYSKGDCGEIPDICLKATFQSIFPIESPDGSVVLRFLDYEIGEPRFDADECRLRDFTYGAPLKVKFELQTFDVDSDTDGRTFRHSKEQEIHLGDVPMMTETGTFVVNGAERVVVSQMHRSPGVFFDHDRGKKSSSGKLRYAARVIPYRGSWLEFEFDTRDKIHFKVDRDVKLPVTTLLYAYGLDRESICQTLYGSRRFERMGGDGLWSSPVDIEALRGTVAVRDMVDAATGEVVVKSGQRVTERVARRLRANDFEAEAVDAAYLSRRPSAVDVIDPATGMVLAEAGAPLSLEFLLSRHSKEVHVLEFPEDGGFVHRMILAEFDFETRGGFDRCDDRVSALCQIYRVARSTEPPSLSAAEHYFEGLFQDPGRYDLSAVGRAKMNERLGLSVGESAETLEEKRHLRTLQRDDVVAVVRELEALRLGLRPVDDIDHLGNRRVRSVGELVDQQYRVGLMRMERAARERIKRINPNDLETLKPEDLVNARSVVSVVREFLAASQLSQFMDQTNPLSEMAHKRRISALGPRGLKRRNASFEVRDVHRTHYGRICPIETPEGANIGLVNSFATFARVNRYGFIETPFREVRDGKVSDRVTYLSATEEKGRRIAQANEPLKSNSEFAHGDVLTREDDGENEEFKIVPKRNVDLIDVSPKQLVSVSASLIPFLENDDASRALMGSNMQRQAVPLLETEAPFVGTGMEEIVARDSGAVIAARRGGVIDQVDASRIVVRVTDRLPPGDLGVDIYRLRKFQRSNQNTAINQRPLVRAGERVTAGDVIADGPSTDFGELALGRNVLVAFMPWQGYNFEDSILVSERIVREDVFTSINIEEFEVVVRDTKLGPEEITRELPNVNEDAKRNLDEAGYVYVGAEVTAGDILVGKVTPKGETPMSPEEKLLRAIFGEKAADVRDTSLRLPPGESGTVVEVRVFTRHGVQKDYRAEQIETMEIENLGRDRADEKGILERNIAARLRELVKNRTLSADAPELGIQAGTKLTEAKLRGLSSRDLFSLGVGDADVMEQMTGLLAEHEKDIERINRRHDDKCLKVQGGDDLQAGHIKVVKVFVAVKRKLQAGDKMAGRHGNKGVISRVLPEEDMPFLADGTPVDVVLNPLGVPSRMNVGQVLETHLGWAAYGLGKLISEALDEYRSKSDSGSLRNVMEEVYGNRVVAQSARSDKALVEFAERARNGVHFATPVFDGARAEDIAGLLGAGGRNASGQEVLYDGRTGEPFERPVTVGYKYLMKLHHQVDDKIHARSTGPYSLVTQQPVRGKARFGGQRVGEMEVWALQAYGAAHTLQEMLTYKSDDVAGRAKVYDAMVKGETSFEAGVPESFNVLRYELMALGMNIELLQEEFDDPEEAPVPALPR